MSNRHRVFASLLSRAWLVLLTSIAAPAALSAQVVAYHGRTSAEHQAFFDDLAPDGYRITSLSVHGDPANPRYSAVWVQRGGPAWIGFHGLNEAAYEAFLVHWASPQNGYRPEILSATGTSTANAVFAGVFVNDGKTYWTDHLATRAEFAESCKIARQSGFLPTSIDVYGTEDAQLYLGVWTPNDQNLAWSYSLAEPGATYQKRYEAMAAGGARPLTVGMEMLGGSPHYAALWVDGTLGGFFARHGMTSAAYQDAVDTFNEDGYYPIRVAGAGAGSATRYAALFARTETPAARQWTVTGTAVAGLTGFDDVMRTFMTDNAIRAGQLAVTKNGRLIYARGYTNAEPGYPLTQPTSLFRIASCAKPLTSMAIEQLVEQGPGTLRESDRVQPILNVSPPAGLTRHEYFDDITVDHLLHHQSGWDTTADGLNYDPQFHDWSFVHDLGLGWSLPVTKQQTVSYMSTEMSFPPGTKARYSNLGYSILGLIVEAKTGLGYEESVRESIFAPVGVTRPFIGGSRRSQINAGEVIYETSNLPVLTSVVDGSGDWVPAQYGGFNVRKFDAHGGWVMAAPDFAKVLASFDRGSNDPALHANPLLRQSTIDAMWANPTADSFSGWIGEVRNGVRVFGHNGAMDGSSGVVLWREDKVSIAVFFNRRASINLWITGQPWIEGLHAVADTANTGTLDLFPSVGIPSFANRSPVAVISLDPPASTLELDPSSGRVSIQVDGRGSFDPDGDSALRYRWTLIGPPTAPSGGTIDEREDDSTRVTFQATGRFILRLEVDDGQDEASSGEASVVIDIVEPGSGPVRFRRGNANGTGAVDLSDAIAALGYLFLGAAELACLEAADTNNDGALDISDPVMLLGHLFLGGAPPAAPGPYACGTDPDAVHLPCAVGCD